MNGARGVVGKQLGQQLRRGGGARAFFRAACRSLAIGLLGAGLLGAGCTLVNDSGEFVIAPGGAGAAGAPPSVVAPLEPLPAGDCRLAGVASRCATDDLVERCSAGGVWEPAPSACVLGCREGVCVECMPGTGECVGTERARRVCGANGRWAEAPPCGIDVPLCVNGECLACNSGQRTCLDGVPQACGADGQWQAQPVCPDGQTCVLATGACTICTPDEQRRCRNAFGACATGEQRCGDAELWLECSIAPAEDSCDIPGDDANCDGRPNSPSTGPCPIPCAEYARCGPDTDVGQCEYGRSECVNGVLGECVGAVGRLGRNCRSPLDNDCDGVADDTIDPVCQCTPDSVEVCPDSPYTDVGICEASRRRCLATAGGTTSAWEEECWGGVGPSTRNCASSEDNDCDGTPDDQNLTCTCEPGTTQACGGWGCWGLRRCEASAAGDATFWAECEFPWAWGFRDPERVGGIDVAPPLRGPSLFNDGRAILFSAGSPEDIFSAGRSDDRAWFNGGERVPGANSDAIDGGPFLGLEHLFFDSNRAGGSRDIFRGTLGMGEWVDVEALASVNSAEDDLDPTLTADERLLVFESGRPGQGGLDLWASSGDGKSFGAPVNLGELNTPDQEQGASLTRDGLGIFFASSRPGGDGRLDLYVAVREARDQPFGAPRHLPWVNSRWDELDVALSPDGRELFFVSDRDGAYQLYRATRACQ